jgi:hypothetical protein
MILVIGTASPFYLGRSELADLQCRPLNLLKRLGRQGWHARTGVRDVSKGDADGVGETVQLYSGTRLRAHGLP